jgi:hypothetical protein
MKSYIIAFTPESGKENCYAESGPLYMHWLKVWKGERGYSLNAHIKAVEALPPNSMVRINQAGDLPTKNNGVKFHVTAKSDNRKTGPIATTTSPICPSYCPMRTTCGGSDAFDYDKALQLLRAASSNGKKAWTYTHYKQYADIKRLNMSSGATVNVSANSEKEAIKAFKQGLPVSVVRKQKDKVETIDGVRFIRCPAQYDKTTTCMTCGNGSPLCSRK